MLYKWVLAIQDKLSSDIILLDYKISVKDVKVMSFEKNLQITQKCSSGKTKTTNRD